VSPETCPKCASQDWIIAESGVLTCKNCGEELSGVVQLCPRCAKENDPGVDQCTSCGETLSIIDRVLSRHVSPGKPRWLEEAREQAGAIKELEEASSKVRLEEMIETDRKREEAVRIEKARQDELERRTLSVTMIGTAVILVIIVIATMVITLRG
jgi:hypothetical protein